MFLCNNLYLFVIKSNLKLILLLFLVWSVSLVLFMIWEGRVYFSIFSNSLQTHPIFHPIFHPIQPSHQTRSCIFMRILYQLEHSDLKDKRVPCQPHPLNPSLANLILYSHPCQPHPLYPSLPTLSSESVLVQHHPLQPSTSSSEFVLANLILRIRSPCQPHPLYPPLPTSSSVSALANLILWICPSQPYPLNSSFWTSLSVLAILNPRDSELSKNC